MNFSKRLDQLPSYPMAHIPAIKRRLLEQGVDLIDVGAGDADFAPPAVAVEALNRAVRDPAMSRYGFQIGLSAFRTAAAICCSVTVEAGSNVITAWLLPRLTSTRRAPGN